MSFNPFTLSDFELMEKVEAKKEIPPRLTEKIDALRSELGAAPEFQVDHFRRLVRRQVRPIDGIVFRRAVADEEHWFFYNRGGDQDQVQLNVGMFREYIRVGLGFMIGRQVSPKIPAFHLLQTFLGLRPPIPFRDALHRCIERNRFCIEGYENGQAAEQVLHRLETYVVPADNSPVFVFLGALWKPSEAKTKAVEDYRRVLTELLPFYEALILMSGRLDWQEHYTAG